MNFFRWLPGIIGLSILGLLLGIILATIIDKGYFTQWQKLPAPPARAKELVTVKSLGEHGIAGVAVRTTDNVILGCTYTLDECWISDQMPSAQDYAVRKLTKPCDSTSVEFSPFTNMPRNTVDCIQATLASLPETGRQLTFALDQDGAVWQWFHLDNSLMNLQHWLLFGCLGGVAGPLFGVVWYRFRRERRQSKIS